jgi:tetratricopeptide (TPR) repeat protein
MQKLYEAVLGEKNSAYYLSKFQQFDQQPIGLQSSWNLCAFFFFGLWALYRKMYGLFFILWGIAWGIAIINKVIAPESPLLFLVPFIVFGIFADSLYHHSVKKKIAAAQLTIKDEAQLVEFLRKKGGVNTWLTWVFSVCLLLPLLYFPLLAYKIINKVPTSIEFDFFYLLIVLAIIFAVYTHWFKKENSQKYTNADWKETKQQSPITFSGWHPTEEEQELYPKHETEWHDITKNGRWEKYAIGLLSLVVFCLAFVVLNQQSKQQVQAVQNVPQPSGTARSMDIINGVDNKSRQQDGYNHLLNLDMDDVQNVPQAKPPTYAEVFKDDAQYFPLAKPQDTFQRATDLYNQGRYAEALPLYQGLAEQGDAQAQNNLGAMYNNGKGVAENHKQAVYWYNKAAEQGEGIAQNNLGVMYDKGKGVAQNDNKAVYWYNKAAEQGLASAQFNLGAMYNNGKGVAQNHKQAVYWVRKAADQGNTHAIAALKKLGQ